MSLINVNQKSSDMESIYKVSSDPWGNGERKLYERLLGSTAQKLISILDDKDIDVEDSEWFDIGCGGGNVTRGFIYNLGVTPHYKGCDISKSALRSISDLYESVYELDLDTFVPFPSVPWSNSDVVTLVEVLYYTGQRRPWKQNLEFIVDGMKEHAILVVADGLVRSQYRDYLKSSSKVKLLDSYTIPEPICEEVSPTGKKWHRYLKVRLYEKVGDTHDCQ